jgi:hypothetical protein
METLVITISLMRSDVYLTRIPRLSEGVLPK